MLTIERFHDGTYCLAMPRASDILNVLQAFRWYNHRWNPPHVKQDLLEGIPKDIVQQLSEAAEAMTEAEIDGPLDIIYNGFVSNNVKEN